MKDCNWCKGNLGDELLEDGQSRCPNCLRKFMKKEDIKTKVNEAFGEVSALFMSQEVKGTEIVMPSEEMQKIAKKLVDDLSKFYLV